MQVPSQPSALDEVIVTARRRAETAQNVPISLTALTGSQVSAPASVGLTHVSELVPSLQVTATNPRQTNINIRGLGATPGFTTLGLENGVGVYIDQVYYSRSVQSVFDLYDIASVEVLRGPQGTLFGKNTTAGAISITTDEPGFTPEMQAELSVGNYESIQARATGTVPLTDTVAIRLTATDTRRHRGFETIEPSGNRANDLSASSVRGQILFQPNDTFKLRAIGDYSALRQDCCTGAATMVRTTRVDGSPLPNNFYDRVARAGYTPLSINPRSRKLETNTPFSSKINTFGFTGIADLDLGFATLTSVTGWRKFHYTPQTDADLIGLDILPNAGIDEKMRQFSQEIRLASNGRNSIDYVFGIYYYSQRIDDRIFVHYGPDAALWILGPATPGGNSPTIGGQAALDGLFADGTARAKARSYAGFGELTWHVMPALNLSVGLRYTDEKKDGYFQQVQRGPVLAPDEIAFGAQAIRNAFTPNIPRYFASTSEDNLSGRGILSYQVTPDILAYVSYSQGFKSGGLNLNATGAPPVVAPEKMQDIEAGVKTALFGRRLVLNFAAFNERIENYQSQQFDTSVASTVYIANVGTVRSRGLEIDATARPLNTLDLFASGAYVDAIYKTFTNAPCPVEYLGLQQVCDLSGRGLPGVSKYSFSLGGEYRLPLGGERQAYLNMSYSHRSSFNAAYNLALDSVAPAYGVTNVRLGLRRTQGQWDIAFYANNLFDTFYLSTLLPSAFNTGQTTAILGNPRTYGLNFKISL